MLIHRPRLGTAGIEGLEQVEPFRVGLEHPRCRPILATAVRPRVPAFLDNDLKTPLGRSRTRPEDRHDRPPGHYEDPWPEPGKLPPSLPTPLTGQRRIQPGPHGAPPDRPPARSGRTWIPWGHHHQVAECDGVDEVPDLPGVVRDRAGQGVGIKSLASWQQAVVGSSSTVTRATLTIRCLRHSQCRTRAGFSVPHPLGPPRPSQHPTLPNPYDKPPVGCNILLPRSWQAHPRVRHPGSVRPEAVVPFISGGPTLGSGDVRRMD